MIIEFNNERWQAGRWLKLRYETVTNKNHSLYEYVQDEIKVGNREPDDFSVSYFLIDNAKIPLDYLYCRYGIMGFDFKAENYPKQINCWCEPHGNIYEPAYCELDEYGESLRIWRKL